MSLRAHGGGIPKCCRFGGEGLHRALAPCTAKVSNIASSELLQIKTKQDYMRYKTTVGTFFVEVFYEYSFLFCILIPPKH